MTPETGNPAAEADFARTLDTLDAARPFAKGMHQNRLLGITQRLLSDPAGVAALYRQAHRFDPAGVFLGSDWDVAEHLQPSLVRQALTAGGTTGSLEGLSQLRFLAIAIGDGEHPGVTAADATDFLESVIAKNIDLLFPEATEVSRERGPGDDRVQRLFEFIVDRLGSGGVLDALVRECERVMRQRPIMIQRVEAMLQTAEHVLDRGAAGDPAGADSRDDDGITDGDPIAGQGRGLDRARFLVDALTGPTKLAREHATTDGYRDALAGLDDASLAGEALEFGACMDATGLVSAPHATLVRFVAEHAVHVLGDALSLDDVGRTSLAAHQDLVRRIIDRAVTTGTARCVYGLSRLLNRGILFFPPVAPGLQHLLVMSIAEPVAELLRSTAGHGAVVTPDALLLAGTLSVIGQPRGIDQGHNPTCQAARGISLWSQNDAGYLLELIARAAGDNDVLMRFEGDIIRSSELPVGLADQLHTELDAVSLVLIEHLDRIYMEMSRRTIGRGEDGHRWVNPEFHGWWVGPGFASVVEPGTGNIAGFDDFIRRFHAAYHPLFNGGRDLVYAQPCGVVSTDPNGEFVGWHAVSIQRIALDPDGVWRMYFFNPNRDKGQTWGPGMETATYGTGEWEGESSLPFEQFAMRLYVFHFRERELGDPTSVPTEVVERIRADVASTWGRDRLWL